jgi:acetylornithine/succinyldiaminopimelate/putrescine aminotransferase/predicted amino acid dehydrogenase
MVRRFPETARPVTDDGGEIHLKPRLAQLLQAIGLDIVYERGAGDHLYYRDGVGREIEVLDMVGGYGSLLLGHSHPVLVAEAQRLLACGRPIHAQGSIREFGERLARELSKRAGGGYRVVFANSGAEAVEAAMKHALLETGGRTFVALENAFHGKTLGAVQLTADEEYRGSFALSGLSVVRVRRNDLGSLDAAFTGAKGLAGFVFEPVQGEGGVWPLDSSFLRRAAELCAARRIPLIADECQTGMGRTGTFLASEALGVRPDYVILSKTLGGGLAKLAALLVGKQRYRDSFDLTHSSTFADDDFSCALGLKTLELIDQSVLERCREKGKLFLARLHRLHVQYPDVIAEVRGRGLLIGLEFRPLTQSPSSLVRFLSSQDLLVLVVAGYLLHAHRIRVAPALSRRSTLRLEPSALVSEDAIEQVCSALEDVCLRLQTHDVEALTCMLSDVPTQGLRFGPTLFASVPARARRPRAPLFPGRLDGRPFVLNEKRFRQHERCPPPVRVGWLCHFIDDGDFTALEPLLANLPVDRRAACLDRFAAFARPVVLNPVDIRSRLGNTARLYPILLPVTSRWMKHWIDTRQLAIPQELVQQGLDVARSLGCGTVSLGQYTSIVTLNGRSLAAGDIGITTGNSYTVALAIQALERANRERGADPADFVLGVAGALGNVGRTCAQMLAPHYRRVLLAGSNKPGSRQRLQELARRIPGAEAATDLAVLASADVVVAAMNAVDAPLGPEHFAPGALVCDLSVPASTWPDLGALRPDLLIIKGGTVRLPFAEDLEIPGFPLPPGHTFGCMAEGLLLGWEGLNDTSFTGSVRPGQVRRIEAMAHRHGFELSDYKRRCVFGSQENEVLHGRLG